MKAWIASLSGAITLAFVHFLLELWRGMMDFSLVLPDYYGADATGLALIAVLYTAVFAVWLFGLDRARQGKRNGIIAALVVGALFWVGVDISTVLFYCPGGCEAAVLDIATYIALVIGALALFGMGSNLRGQAGQQAAREGAAQ